MTIALSESTVNTRLKTLRAFSRYLYDERILDENPLLKVKNLDEPLEEIDKNHFNKRLKIFAKKTGINKNK